MCPASDTLADSLPQWRETWHSKVHVCVRAGIQHNPILHPVFNTIFFSRRQQRAKPDCLSPLFFFLPTPSTNLHRTFLRDVTFQRKHVRARTTFLVMPTKKKPAQKNTHKHKHKANTRTSPKPIEYSSHLHEVSSGETKQKKPNDTPRAYAPPPRTSSSLVRAALYQSDTTLLHTLPKKNSTPHCPSPHTNACTLHYQPVFAR